MILEDGSHFAALVQRRIATAGRLRGQVNTAAVQYIAIVTSTTLRFADHTRRGWVRSCRRRVGRRDGVLCARGVCHRA